MACGDAVQVAWRTIIENVPQSILASAATPDLIKSWFNLGSSQAGQRLSLSALPLQPHAASPKVRPTAVTLVSSLAAAHAARGRDSSHACSLHAQAAKAKGTHTDARTPTLFLGGLEDGANANAARVAAAEALAFLGASWPLGAPALSVAHRVWLGTGLLIF